jgi:putative methionine-R-sulfoxide reductase with GAF domain
MLLNDNVLRPKYVTGDHSRLFSVLEIQFGQGVSGWVAENRKAVINGNPAVEPGYFSDEPNFTPMRSALSVPLAGTNGSGKRLVALSLRTRRLHPR